MTPVSLSPITKGLQFARYTAALARFDTPGMKAAAYAADKWPDTPAVAAVIKASIGAAGGAPGSWGSDLVSSGLADDFLQAVRARTVVDRLPGVRRVPFRTRVPVESTSGAGGAWVGSGQAIPVSASAFDVVSLATYEGGAMIVITEELLELMTRAAVATIQESLIAGLVRFLDRQFLDPSVAAVADVQPAAITNGATQISSTGTTAAAITADLATMIAAADELVSPVWIANGKTIANIAGITQLPGVALINGTLLGIPILSTKSSPAPVGSPAMPRLITLVDASAVLLADDGVADVSTSKVTTIQMSDAPTANAATGTATTATSMMQTHSSAAKVVRQIAWARARNAGVVYMEVSY